MCDDKTTAAVGSYARLPKCYLFGDGGGTRGRSDTSITAVAASLSAALKTIICVRMC